MNKIRTKQALLYHPLYVVQLSTSINDIACMYHSHIELYLFQLVFSTNLSCVLGGITSWKPDEGSVIREDTAPTRSFGLSFFPFPNMYSNRYSAASF